MNTLSKTLFPIVERVVTTVDKDDLAAMKCQHVSDSTVGRAEPHCAGNASQSAHREFMSARHILVNVPTVKAVGGLGSVRPVAARHTRGITLGAVSVLPMPEIDGFLALGQNPASKALTSRLSGYPVNGIPGQCVPGSVASRRLCRLGGRNDCGALAIKGIRGDIICRVM